MSQYELNIIEFESARNEAMDAYFDARPELFRARGDELLFEGGFRMAWEHLKSKDNINIAN